jgi:hypothetical protein
MNHPLDGAKLRLTRAQEHLAELESISFPFIENEYALAEKLLKVNPEPGVPFEFQRPESPIPSSVPLIVGETIYNLRAALDYLVYEIAKLDSNGTPQNGTQFPIEDTPNGFKGRRKSYLKGVNDAHAAHIESLQPYNGVKWTGRLRAISNPDKHRYLTTQTHNTGAVGTISNDPATFNIPNGVKGMFINVQIDAPQRVYMQFHVTLFIAFDDGFPVIETLQELHTQVANTVSDFESEF